MSFLAVPLGLLVGLLLGALGGGGAILTVPLLVFVLGQDPRTATTSSLLIVGVTSLMAAVPHLRGGRVRVGQGLLLGVLGVAGSLAGSALSVRVPTQVLLTAFALLMVVVGVLMLRRSTAPPGGDPSPGLALEPMLTLRPLSCACPRVLRLVVTATAVGLLTGFFGVGGGFALVPALVLVLGYPMPVAVGTSLLVIALNSVTALAARFAAGAADLEWMLIGTFTVAAVVGALAGSRATERADPRLLTRTFAVVMLGVAAYTALRSVPGLP